MKNSIIGAAVLSVLFASTLSGCNAGQAREATSTEESTPLPVSVASPFFTDIAATYTSTGTLTADSEAAITARATGDVVEIIAEEGDRVVRGQVLARLDGDRARLGLRQARAEYERNTREFERLGKLHERGLVSSAALDTLEAELTASRAAWERARLNVEYTSIRATIDGVVSRRDVKIGSTLNEGEVAFVVTDTADLVAYLDIPQTELPKFAVGFAASLEVDSHPDRRFQATVARVSPTINPDTGMFRATMAVDNAAGELAPGMFGNFSVAWQIVSDALVIPESAAITEDNQTVVFVVRDGEAVRRIVETGIRSDGLVEVIRGLSLDEDIVLAGQSRLRDGSRVLARAADPAKRIRG